MPFNLPAALDAARPYSDWEDRTIIYDRYWQIDNVNGYLQELYEAVPLSGLEIINSYASPTQLVDIAIEPFTNGMWVASSSQLFYVDRREYMADLSETGLTTEPLYGLQVARDITKLGPVVYIQLSGTPYANSINISQYQYTVNFNGIVSSILPDGFLGPNNAGWGQKVPQPVSIPLLSLGSYIFTLQCQDINGVITEDIFPYLNPQLTPLQTIDMHSQIDNIVGMGFDSYGQLWLWNGSFAYTLNIHYDGYIVDPTSNSIFVTEAYDSLQIS